ncbi:MAG: hypothetical protein JRI68_27935, partial [Deltaproteobacteria bacterium]|nr:hypothetical protein [Deltaproteobacteria bacterium]
MQPLVILQVFMLLTPQQKQLVKMVKQGDMIAGDDLARSICEIPEEKRKKDAERVLKRLKKVENRARDLAIEGIEKCMPKEPEKKPEKKAEAGAKDKDKKAEAKDKKAGAKDKKAEAKDKDKEKKAEAKDKDKGKEAEARAEKKAEDDGDNKERRGSSSGTSVADAERSTDGEGRRRPILGLLDEADGEKKEGRDPKEDKAAAAKSAAEKDMREAEKARKTEKERKAEEKRLAAEERKAEKERKAEEKRLAAEERKAERKRKAEEKRLAAEERKAERKRKAEEERRAAEERKREKETRVAMADTADEPADEALGAASVEDEIPEIADIEPVAADQRQPAATGGALAADAETMRSALLSYGVGGGLMAVSSVGFVAALAALTVGAFQTADLMDQPGSGVPDSDAIATTWLAAGGVALLAGTAATAEVVIGWML